ncbi:DNA replication and repair protein RecO [Albidovulum inexpectatum]|uniref:DNA repair protein RecO n=2 Tax=Albidovulum inexpectatum TaxID=196587 RepID=A0A2S5JLC0_9RHOB|nr:DNA replication and repair protein RecO [Albidovulum inexpectatum]
MEWRDHGLLLTLRRHGENSAIVEVFAHDHGRHAGVVRGATSRRMAGVLQPGSQVDVTWRGRLEEHIGTFAVEPVRSRAAILSDADALAGLNSVCALLHVTLPEREPHRRLYAGTVALLDAMAAGQDWRAAYLRWEMLLLDDLGYGLDLSACAVTGSDQDLAWVSPRSGRAVSRAAGAEWADRLLQLPPCLRGGVPRDNAELVAALQTTGWFLEHRLLRDLHRPLPEARARLIARLSRAPGLPSAQDTDS